MQTIIETERLLLREIVVEDKEQMYLLHSEPEVQKYTGEPVMTSMEAMAEAIQVRSSNYQKDGYGRWATILK